MRSNHNRLILLKTALIDQCGDALFNTVAIGDKGRERIVKVRTEVRPEGLVGNATGDLFVIHYRQKPDHPCSCIIGFTGREFYTHKAPYPLQLLIQRGPFGFQWSSGVPSRRGV